ncbi:hydantoinase/oxoprolinase family protein [Dactylosporangium sp. CA-092794]|uniref:hydantoinase/oxoprolinase family protein n=1 Tax=Dactylosporangium sp. CA-092794 TaxID=3239929 RepID=UPI003D8EC4EE
MTASKFSVGTDIGGTFTDMVVIDDRNVVHQFKTPTTPSDRSQGVVDAFNLAAAEFGISPAEFAARVVYFAHGTTAATNALIERKGEPTGIITTRGMEDTLLVQRSMGSWTGIGQVSGHYSRRRNPDPLVDRSLIIGVDERRDFEGDEIVRLDAEQVRAAARRLRDAGAKAVAVSFLWSFVNPEHERDAARLVRQEWPDVFLTSSSEIAPVIGEYERTATTVINSYLGPVISRYIRLLEHRLKDMGFVGDFTVLDSTGGVMDADEAGDRAVGMIMSGPAGGVLASAALARKLGYPNVITSDMGGTSFDAGLIVDGEPLVTTTSIADRYHLATPRVQVTAIGSGGGSIASVDEGGILVVGPESAGADPGPACYGKGGKRPTVTDADVVLGIIDPDFFLGGRFKLHRELAEEAVGRYIAEPLGLSVVEAAVGIRRVADNQMADLLRAVTVQQGYDPRDFVVFAYGGAGPTHAYAFAEEAGIDTIVVPYTGTTHSAFGAVSCDRYRSFQGSDPQRTPPGSARPAEHLDLGRINRKFEELERQCRAAMKDHPELRLNRTLYFRFNRQAHELPIAVPDHTLTAEDFDRLLVDFRQSYERIYGPATSLPEAGVEINTFRLEGRIPARSTGVTGAGRTTVAEHTDVPAPIGSRSVVFSGTPLSTTVYAGERLPAGVAIAGPAIAEFPGTTVVIGPDQKAVADRDGHIVITPAGK